jgi:hypothetical protein
MWALYEMVARLAVGGFLVACGVGKLTSVWTWRQIWLATYQLVPRVVVRPAALALPFLELQIGVLLVLGGFGRVSAVAAGALLAATTAAIGVAAVRGLTISAGCLSRLAPLLSRRVIARNVVFIGAMAVVAAHGITAPAITALDTVAEIVVLAAVSAAALTYVGFSRRGQQRRLLAEFAAA